MYCYIGIAVEVVLQVGAQRGRVVVVGQVPFLLDPIADEDKEDGAR